jgi:spore maturation protein CgeB
LSISSSWGNGHATIWRGLCKGLKRLHHDVTFFERDTTYYADHRDLTELPGGTLMLYADWSVALPSVLRALSDTDVAIVTSYCPDAQLAADLVLNSRTPIKVFYDLDTPITLSMLEAGRSVPYLPSYGLAGFDLVFSYTAGKALELLRSATGARNVIPLYGSVDPEVHKPHPPREEYSSFMSYLGTFAEDRQLNLEELFVKPSHDFPSQRFMLGGAMYPPSFPWSRNIFYRAHVPPLDHAKFFCSSRVTLNITRSAMAEMGYCPSGRLFEAAACGAAVLSDRWEGLDMFFEPGSEILTASSSCEVCEVLQASDAELSVIGKAARQRALEEHTSDRRALEMVQAIKAARIRVI